jgi:hypothetical protein
MTRYEDLTPEQEARARECKTPEELLALAKEEGFSLTDEQLESISGGRNSCSNFTTYDPW